MLTTAMAHNRFSSVEVLTVVCDKCKLETRCMVIDTSEGEYGCVSLCLKCVCNEFDLPNAEAHQREASGAADLLGGQLGA
jgi:hypothetical protein